LRDENLRDIIESFEDIPVVKKGEYSYFVHPLSDGIPLIDPILLEKAAGFMSCLIPAETEFDALITAEAMGIPLTAMISKLMSKHFSIVRKRGYGISGEIEIHQSTGYSNGSLFINLPSGKKRYVIVDDVLSTGGTLRSMIDGIRSSGSEPVGVIILVDKMGATKRERMERDMGLWIRPLLYVDIDDGKCMVEPSEYI
jgi:adenine phosphoribosyltransferase